MISLGTDRQPCSAFCMGLDFAGRQPNIVEQVEASRQFIMAPTATRIAFDTDSTAKRQRLASRLSTD
ncbi:MAG: hypothetical protein OJF60_000967 [Burkholderiaceae bacterium]|nr:MAG: hypothetical protein OJF60_000967 [Burkholderiaceae bacterium]